MFLGLLGCHRKYQHFVLFLLRWVVGSRLVGWLVVARWFVFVGCVSRWFWLLL